MNKEMIYDCRWSGQADEKFTKDFILVENTVFHNGYDKALFQKKYIENIYGESIVAVVYDAEKPVAARALWRNDLSGQLAYQPADTCVLEEYQGQGIFGRMTKKAKEMIGREALIYNFPNQKSFPGYLKMGWELQASYRPRLFWGNRRYRKEHPLPMDKKYANWWLRNLDGHFYIQKGDTYYLAYLLRSCCYFMVAELPKEIALKFPKAKFGLKFYRSQKQTWYNKKLGVLNIVSDGKQDIDIPTWKIDAI